MIIYDDITRNAPTWVRGVYAHTNTLLFDQLISWVPLRLQWGTSYSWQGSHYLRRDVRSFVGDLFRLPAITTIFCDENRLAINGSFEAITALTDTLRVRVNDLITDHWNIVIVDPDAYDVMLEPVMQELVEHSRLN